MSRLRLSVVVVATATLLSLTACIGAPSESASPTPTPTPDDWTTVDVAAVEELMRAALPTAPDDHDVVNETGLDEPTFGADWSVVDHDAQRVARVLRGAVSPGWADSRNGPGYSVVWEIVLMESDDAAGTAFNALAAAVAEPYTVDSDDGTVKDELAPVAEPSGRWPFGTVEQTADRTWSSGERASGWIVSYLSGPFIMRSSALAVPGNDSAAALASFADATAPEFTTAIDALLPGLTALG